MTTRTLTGGCQCGRIRYTAQVDPAEAYLCHCKMCRRATGGVSVAYVNTPHDTVTWEREPDWYQSSAIAHRPFCAHCGTPLGFAFLEGGNLDITVGSFDDPTPFRPSKNYAVESMLTAWTDVRHLPGTTSGENDAVVKRWQAAGMEPPE
ncbi:GFA family protein [Novosphingobium soli]|uniref:GFA family protein n=1 Tax=Novosphingobium soli TaxID=574956 RepID=A0ABV6CW70_9SPHN